MEDFDEEPTKPVTSISVVQRELDSAVSVAEGYLARGEALGYDRDAAVPLPTWIDRLEEELAVTTEVEP